MSRISESSGDFLNKFRKSPPVHRHEYEHQCEHELHTAHGRRASRGAPLVYRHESEHECEYELHVHKGAERAERIEASEAPPFYADMSTDMNYSTPLCQGSLLG